MNDGQTQSDNNNNGHGPSFDFAEKGEYMATANVRLTIDSHYIL